MGNVLAEILPLAIGVALSPLPIVAVILMLFSKNPRGTSLGFLAGWFLGVAVVATVVVFVADPAQQATGGEDSPLAAVFRVLLGVVLLVLAYKDWKKRPQPGEQPGSASARRCWRAVEAPPGKDLSIPSIRTRTSLMAGP